VNLVILENDFRTRMDLEAFEKAMESMGFYIDDVLPNIKGLIEGVPGLGWGSGPPDLKNFITVWRRTHG
jgi:hypothetical protein